MQIHIGISSFLSILLLYFEGDDESNLQIPEGCMGAVNKTAGKSKSVNLKAFRKLQNPNFLW